MMPPMTNSYRHHLTQVVAASTAPYGYTLTLWTSGAIATHAHGVPSSTDAVLLLAGAVAAFASVGLAASGHLHGTLPAAATIPTRVWGGVHIPSVGLSILFAHELARWASGALVWPLIGFASTATYLLALAAQFWAVGRTGVRLDGVDFEGR